MTTIGDYNAIMSDRNLFNKIVYTPMSEALRLLEERRKDKDLMAKINDLLKGDIPDVFLSKGPCAVLSRHVATPNHETRMFISIAKENGMFPVFFEYHEDKFTSNNNYKHSLGQLRIQKGSVDKKGDPLFDKITIVDFNTYNGRKLKEVKTIWGESLIDFHRKLFPLHKYESSDMHLLDASYWFKGNGGRALDYYTNLLLMFTCYGVLFENFLTAEGSEGEFTRKIVLPAIDRVMELTGVKPLITPIGPLEIENDDLWFFHLSDVRQLIPK